ncbi:branched-subunit amino acid aminotransferase/4-amino-4-deoxychorismate lyase [Actinoplanes tereljensis]|uniref:Uncharacterized protein n=1 Tax=Paractinoplanes tereljensis TaxID=571912 RepID=A0A919NRD8_9ACTN|nr:aminotransferase class IV [Actinoplanes tereljensis]GIF23288.1 hypothetical protein Ate02nite_60180 [Actinoplanes tereljensis]
MTRVEINGVPASIDGLHRAATGNYGHFTSMQVRSGAVAGLAFHLRRLQEASAELFAGRATPSDRMIVDLINHALGEQRNASVRVTVLPDVFDVRGTDVMVSVGEPVPDNARAPLRVCSVGYERELPHLKHVATMGLTYHHLQARRAGFDDVLFVRHDGRLAEGSVWNIAFWDGERVIWPSAPQLPGITMQVLRIGLAKLGIPDEQRRLTGASLAGMRAAVAVNSHCPAQPIGAIDAVILPEFASLTTLLLRAWNEVAWDELGPAR